MTAIPNVLAARYASTAMTTLWSPEHKVRLERRLWLAVLQAQADLGIDVPLDVIADYEAAIDDVRLDSIADRERVTRHDVKARIEEFNDLAGHEHIHKGMTSRDLTENVEQLQIRESLVLVRAKVIAVLARLARLAAEYTDTAMAGRSHNVAAQTTTLGKRFANAADELIAAYRRLDDLLRRYPLRGIKGPMGTSQDMLDLLGGDAAKLAIAFPVKAGGTRSASFEVVGLDDDVAYLVCVCHAAHAAPVRHEVPRARFTFPLTRDQYRAACASGWPDHPARVSALMGWTDGSREEN